VQLFFLIASTDTAVHLYVLAKLSRLLRRPEVREALLKARTPAAVLEIISDAEAHLS
jgi:mannitol/fructose-specific phosphotransferase system IIA component (Ntr-type)